jgi:hypothetical protein
MAKNSPYAVIDEARFWSKVQLPDAPRNENLCWIWKGSTAKGYGQIKIGGEVLRAHRVSCEIANGPLAPGEHVLHSCDNPLCVNFKHLRTGTHQDNMTDKKDRNRAWRYGPVTDIFG